MKKFYVLQPHVDGTTIYAVGDRREVDENEVRHLVELGVLGDKKPDAAKPAPAPAPLFEPSSAALQIRERDEIIGGLKGDIEKLRQDGTSALQANTAQFEQALSEANTRADDLSRTLTDTQQQLKESTEKAEAAEAALGETNAALSDMTKRAEAAEAKAADLAKSAKAAK